MFRTKDLYYGKIYLQNDYFGKELKDTGRYIVCTNAFGIYYDVLAKTNYYNTSHRPDTYIVKDIIPLHFKFPYINKRGIKKFLLSLDKD